MGSKRKKTYSKIHGREDQLVPMTILSFQERKTIEKLEKRTDFVKKGKNTHVKMKHPIQVPPQMKNTLTPKLAALIAFIPVVDGLTR